MARERRYHPPALFRRRLAQIALERGGLLALVAVVLYLWIAPTYIVYGDNAELSALGTIGGAAHPSGYPLYLLWLRLWSWLPVASPAHAAAIATVILTGIQVLVMHAACRAWGARPAAATLAVGLFVAGPIVMRIQSEAEVFALNGLMVSAVLWLAADNGPLRGYRRAFGLGLAAGLGMSNHLTCVLVAPVGLLGAWRATREVERRRAVAVGLAGLGLVIGLLPYAYLIATPETWISWGKITDLRGVIDHVLRKDYGGPGQFSPVAHHVGAVENLRVLAQSIGRAYLWVPSAVGVAALGYFAARRGPAEPRIGWALLAASWLLAGPLLVLKFNVEPVGTGLYVVQRFHILACVVLAIPIAAAIDQVAAARIPERFASSAAIHAVATVFGFAAIAAPSLPYVARMHSPGIEIGLHNMLRTLPPDAIVMGAPDAFHFGLGYLQGALGERRDVTTITTPQLGLAYYRERVRQRTGIVIVAVPEGSEAKLTVNVAEQALATGRPLFIDPYQANVAAAFLTYPYGLLFRVLPRGTPRPSMLEVFAINKELFGRYTFGYAFPGPDDQLVTQFHRQYARAWGMIAQGLEVAGNKEELAFALAMAAELAPQDP